jgi:hypothetical protein
MRNKATYRTIVGKSERQKPLLRPRFGSYGVMEMVLNLDWIQLA